MNTCTYKTIELLILSLFLNSYEFLGISVLYYLIENLFYPLCFPVCIYLSLSALDSNSGLTQLAEAKASQIIWVCFSIP